MAYWDGFYEYVSYYIILKIFLNPHTYTHAYTPTYTHAYTPTYTHAYTPTYTHAYTPTYTHAYTPTYTHAYTPTYTHAYTHAYTPTYTHHRLCRTHSIINLLANRFRNFASQQNIHIHHKHSRTCYTSVYKIISFTLLGHNDQPM